MRHRYPLVLAGIFLPLIAAACAPQPIPTIPAAPPTASPAAVTTTAAAAPATMTPAPPTAPADESTLEEPTWPATPSVPQPPAPAHFHAGDAVQLDEIHMIDRSAGWGISGPYVLVTLDGGKTWRETTPPVDTSAGDPDRVYGAFLDAHTAWVVFSLSDQILPEAQVWHTADGGASWTPGAPLMHQVNAESVWAEFAALDASNVWLLVRGVYHGAGTHFTHELFHTGDGGLTWTSLDGEISDDYTGMVFADEANGLRTLQTTGAYAAAPAAYDVTADGGATWTNVELPAPDDAPDLFTRYPYCETYQPVYVMQSAQSIRMLVGCFDEYEPPKQFVSYFYSSQDGGATWTTVRLPATVQAAQDSLLYFGQNNALLLGRDMYLSTSDGQDWVGARPTPVNWDGQFSFSDPQYGWAVARSNGEVALVQTTDWARTWTVIKPVIAR